MKTLMLKILTNMFYLPYLLQLRAFESSQMLPRLKIQAQGLPRGSRFESRSHKICPTYLRINLNIRDTNAEIAPHILLGVPYTNVFIFVRYI